MTMSQHNVARLADVRQVDQPVEAARDKLRNAFAVRHTAEAEAEQAAQAVARTRRLYEDATQQLRELDARDEADRAAQAENLKAHARDGTLRVTLNLDPERANQRRSLEANAVVAKRACDDLAAEHAAAVKRASEAAAQVLLAAVEVVRAEACRLGAELKAAQEKTWTLNAQLAGLAGAWLAVTGERPSAFRLPSDVHALLDRAEPMYAPFSDPRRRATEAWRAFFQALARNPDAVFPPG
jgi:hypothetical protein